MKATLSIAICLFAAQAYAILPSKEIHFRVNQLGYHPTEQKLAIIFCESIVHEHFELIEAEKEKTTFKLEPVQVHSNG